LENLNLFFFLLSYCSDWLTFKRNKLSGFALMQILQHFSFPPQLIACVNVQEQHWCKARKVNIIAGKLELLQHLLIRVIYYRTESNALL